MTTQYHKYVSYFKSGIRVGTCILALCVPLIHSIYFLAVGLLLAEVLGIVEELKE